MALNVLTLYRDARPFAPPPELRGRVLRSELASSGTGRDIAFDAHGFPVDDRPATRATSDRRAMVLIVVALGLVAILRRVG